MYSLLRFDLKEEYIDKYGEENKVIYLLEDLSQLYGDVKTNYCCPCYIFIKNVNSNFFRIMKTQIKYYGQTDMDNRKQEKNLSNIFLNFFGNIYSYNVNIYDVICIINTESYSEIKRKAEECKIVLFEPYEDGNTDDLPFNIINKTNIDSSKVLDILSNIHINKINNIDYKFNGRNDFSLFFNNQGRYSTRKGVYCYTSSNYYDWFNTHFSDNFVIPSYIISFNYDYSNNFYYVKVNKNTIIFSQINISFKYNKDKIDVTIILKKEYSYSLNGNKFCKVYLKTKEKDISPIELFNINKSTINHGIDSLIFDNASNIYEFISDNEFFEKCGFLKLLSECNIVINITSYMLIFFTLIYEYPVMELIIKMGHTNLVEDIFKTLISQGNKASIIENVENLEQLINKNTTKGSSSLRIPSYIGDYLMKNKSNLKEYLFWRDIFEITNISKENFEKFLSSKERIFINASLNNNSNAYNWYSLDIPEIVKYGYDFNKTIKYIFDLAIKPIKCDNFSFVRNDYRFYFNILKDTLKMAEELDFVVEKYPENLRQVHDQLSKIISDISNSIEETVVADISKDCNNYLEKVFNSDSANLPKNAMEKYCYVFPTCQKDFSQEGQNQHNCVAGYYNSVIRGDCIIFFVREKENPNVSYITVEITKYGLGQVMFSNNRPVSSGSIQYQYCKYIANMILKSVKKEDILALNKISKRISEERRKKIISENC